MAGLADIPFLSGFNQQNQVNEQQTGQQLQQAGTLAQLLAHMQSQAGNDRVRSILSTSSPEDALVMLPKAGPEGIQAAHSLAATLAASQDIADRKALTNAYARLRTAAPTPDAAPQPQTGVTNPTADGQPAASPKTPQQQMASSLLARAQQYQTIFDSDPAIGATKAGQSLLGEITKLTAAAARLDPTETFHAPVPGMGPSGPTFSQYGSRGTVRPIDPNVSAPMPHPMTINQGDKETVIDAIRPNSAPLGTFKVSATPSARLASQTAYGVANIRADAPHSVVGVDADGNQVLNWGKPSDGTQSFDTRPPGSLNIDMSAARQIQNRYSAETKGERDILAATNRYSTVRQAGDFAQAAGAAANILQRAMTAGNTRFKGEAGKILGSGYGGGSIPERLANFLSTEATGTPTSATMAKLDALVNSAEQSAVENFANRTSFYAGQAQGRGLPLKTAIGLPYTFGNSVIFPDGTHATFGDPAAASGAAKTWAESNK